MTVRSYLKDRISFVAATVFIMVVLRLLGFACKTRMDFIWVMEGIIFCDGIVRVSGGLSQAQAFLSGIAGNLRRA